MILRTNENANIQMASDLNVNLRRLISSAITSSTNQCRFLFSVHCFHRCHHLLEHFID